jgi:carbamoyl-phosphate synthase large subunit
MEGKFEVESQEVILPSDASPKDSLTILFTSAGRRVELLRAFRAASVELGLETRLLVTDIDPLAPAIQLADDSYIVPRVSDPSYPEALAEICEREGVTLVFPLIDPDILILSKNRVLLERSGCTVVVVDEWAAEVTRDKWHTYEFLRDLDVPTPETWLPAVSIAPEETFPLFIKPRFGSAGKNTYVADDANQLHFFCDYLGEPIVQEYLEGPEITNDVSCSLDGEILMVVSRQRIEVRWGEVAKGVTVDEPGIRADCVRIAQALGAIGPITIQCMLHHGQPRYTEINARFGGGLPLGIAAGADSPKWYLAFAAGLPLELPAMGAYRKGLYITRFDESYFLGESDIDRIASRRL